MTFFYRAGNMHFIPHHHSFYLVALSTSFEIMSAGLLCQFRSTSDRYNPWITLVINKIHRQYFNAGTFYTHTSVPTMGSLYRLLKTFKITPLTRREYWRSALNIFLGQAALQSPSMSIFLWPWPCDAIWSHRTLYFRADMKRNLIIHTCTYTIQCVKLNYHIGVTLTLVLYCPEENYRHTRKNVYIRPMYLAI